MTKVEEGIRLGDIEKVGDLPDDLYDSRVCYWKGPTEWWIYLPRGGIGRLTHHEVIEHEDRTITVRPSIGMYRGSGKVFARHGYLTRGVWKEC